MVPPSLRCGYIVNSENKIISRSRFIDDAANHDTQHILVTDASHSEGIQYVREIGVYSGETLDYRDEKVFGYYAHLTSYHSVE